MFQSVKFQFLINIFKRLFQSIKLSLLNKYIQLKHYNQFNIIDRNYNIIIMQKTQELQIKANQELLKAQQITEQKLDKLVINQEGAKDQPNDQQEKKKKKKKRNKKKKPKVQGAENQGSQSEEETEKKQDIKLVNQKDVETQDNAQFRCLGGWKTPISIKFPNQKMSGYPQNQIHQYKIPRISNQQAKKREVFLENHLQYMRKAAQIHRQVRRYAQRIIKPGRRLIDICEEIQNYNRKLTADKGLQAGIAFPTGCSLNHVAAHYTPNNGDFTILKEDDVCKIDFGTHIHGRIIDCAFTVAFNPTYDKLLEAVKDATNTGVRQSGIDARLGQIGARIEQTMTSYQVEIKGQTIPVKVVKNLNGHSIDCFHIHAGKTVPCIKNGSNVKMQQGETYAIQTFGSTGKGVVRQDGECSHYMKDFDLPSNAKIPGRSKGLYNFINQKFSTLAFCKRWLDRGGQTQHILPLRDLVQNGIVNTYPPLCDVQGSYVAQWEHTLLLRPTCKQVLSRGQDF